jgi:hypothetical protein
MIAGGDCADPAALLKRPRIQPRRLVEQTTVPPRHALAGQHDFGLVVVDAVTTQTSMPPSQKVLQPQLISLT